jgi:MFS family permease
LVLAAVFLLFVRDYKTVALPSERSTRRSAKTRTMSARAIAAALMRPRTALITCLGAGFQLVMVSTTYAWLPSYFNRYYGLAPDQAAVKTGIVVLLSGLGAVLWSVVADRLSSRFPRARLYVPAAAGLLTAAFMCVAFGALSPGPFQFALIMAGAIVMTGSIGPACAVVVDVVHSSVRATAASVLSLTQNLFGLAAGPLLAGVLSDTYGLPFAMAVVPLFCVFAAGVFVIAARTYETDLKQVEGVELKPGNLEPQAA